MKDEIYDSLWTVYQNANAMITTRGFFNNAITNKKFKTLVNKVNFSRRALDFVARRHESSLKVIFWQNVAGKKMGVVAIRNMLTMLKSSDIKHVVLISVCNITAQGKKAIAEINRSNVFVIEHFTDSYFGVNITKHEMASPHRIMSADETKMLLRTYRVELDKLPKILKIDAMCRYLGATVGQCIEITRNSETAGKTLYYRTVID